MKQLANKPKPAAIACALRIHIAEPKLPLNTNWLILPPKKAA